MHVHSKCNNQIEKSNAKATVHVESRTRNKIIAINWDEGCVDSLNGGESRRKKEGVRYLYVILRSLVHIRV